MRVLVCGGRDFNDHAMVFERLDALHQRDQISLLIEGGARGADALAAEWALARRVPSRRFTAQWDVHGRSAGPIRNQKMLDEGKPDLVVAFPGGRGTANMIALAKTAGVYVTNI